MRQASRWCRRSTRANTIRRCGARRNRDPGIRRNTRNGSLVTAEAARRQARPAPSSEAADIAPPHARPRTRAMPSRFRGCVPRLPAATAPTNFSISATSRSGRRGAVEGRAPGATRGIPPPSFTLRPSPPSRRARPARRRSSCAGRARGTARCAARAPPPCPPRFHRPRRPRGASERPRNSETPRNSAGPLRCSIGVV